MYILEIAVQQLRVEIARECSSSTRRLISLIPLIMLSFFPFGCADEEVPNAPKRSTVEDTADQEKVPQRTEGNVANESESEYYGWGAKIGTSDVLRRLADCNSAGSFFDRVGEEGKGTCDESRAVPFKCIDYESVIKATKMTESQVANVDRFLENQLEGYLFDQCVEEEGAYLVYLVSQDDDGQIFVSKMTVDKP